MKGLLFTYVMAYGGAVLSLFRPFHGLLIYICFAIIKPEALWWWSVTPGNYSRIIALALFVGWALKGFGNWRLGRAWPVAVALALYLAWSAVSALGAADQELAWTTVEWTAKLVLPVLVGMTLIDSVARVRQVAWVIVVSLGYLALEFNLSYYDGFNRIATVGFAGMEEKTVANTMVVGVPLALFLAIGSREWWSKVVAFGALALMLHVPLFTFSRSGMLALIAAAIAAFVLIPKRGLHVAALVLVVALGFRLAGDEVRSRFQTSFADSEERDPSAQARLFLWERSFDTIRRFPIVGVGPRHWGWWIQEEYNWQRPQEVHNTWLQAGAELGLPAAMGLACYFFLTTLQLVPLARNRLSADADKSECARMVVASLAGYAVSSQFITVYGVEPPYFVAMMGVGLLAVHSAERTAAANEPLGQRARIAFVDRQTASGEP